MNNQNSNDLSEIIARALNEMKLEAGDSFDLEKVNLAELERRTKISRKKLRKIKEDGFVIKPHGLLGTQKANTVLSGFTDTIDSLLKRGVSNSSVIQERLKEMGYTGSRTQLQMSSTILHRLVMSFLHPSVSSFLHRLVRNILHPCQVGGEASRYIVN